MSDQQEAIDEGVAPVEVAEPAEETPEDQAGATKETSTAEDQPAEDQPAEDQPKHTQQTSTTDDQPAEDQPEDTQQTSTADDQPDDTEQTSGEAAEVPEDKQQQDDVKDADIEQTESRTLAAEENDPQEGAGSAEKQDGEAPAEGEDGEAPTEGEEGTKENGETPAEGEDGEAPTEGEEGTKENGETPAEGGDGEAPTEGEEGTKEEVDMGGKEHEHSGTKQGKKHCAESDVGHHEPTVSGRTTDPLSRTTSVSTNESSVLDNGSTIIKLKNREMLFASRSEDMSMIAKRPPDDVEEAKAMLARASALGTQMLVKPPSPPPIPVDTESMGEDKTQLSALNLTWAFGMNRHVAVVNLSTETRRAVVYACAHTAVLYDMDENTQQLLQGHSNNITSICVSKDKRWIATADKGPDHVVLIWDSSTGFPVRTMFEPYPGSGVESIRMTDDAKYLATLSSAKTQQFCVWDWTVERETPICTAELSPSFGAQRYIYFNPEDMSQVVTNSDSQVIFYAWDLKGNIEYFAPPLADEDFNKPVGKYSQSIFLANCSKALTATSFGNLVVWSANKPLTKIVTDEPTPDKKALKLVKIQDRAITVLTTMDHYLVMGDVCGQVRFMDQNLKLVNWYQDIQLGPIFAVSFTYNSNFSYVETAGFDYPMDAMLSGRSLAIRDFVVATTTGIYAHIGTAGSIMRVIHRDHDAAVHALATHPSEPWIAVGSYSGLLKIWDYEQKEVLVSRYFEKGLHIRCCTFDPNSYSIAVGFTNGMMRLVEAISLDDLQQKPFHLARDAITHIAFSHDCRYLATADAEFTVSVFKREEGSETFMYLGRNRAHYKTINDITFGVQLDSNQARLLSLGADRYLVEYDLEGSSKDDLHVLSTDRIEQSAVALCMDWYPPVTKENFIFTANHQYKFKLYNSTTKMCRKTLLAPTYGSPVNRIKVVPSEDPNAARRYMAYVTNDKVGLQILPLDGNPHKSAGLIAHPHGVSNLAVSYDGKFVFTSGGPDAVVFMWKVSTSSLETQAALGGGGPPSLLRAHGWRQGRASFPGTGGLLLLCPAKTSGHRHNGHSGCGHSH
ncbi:cilia and flagella associated protein 251 [Lamellibrachia satsuma]|nr:cilia and flagella associated protein 251 [Lamellibrachia satsuma]